MLLRPPSSPLFPYTTLFRSAVAPDDGHADGRGRAADRGARARAQHVVQHVLPAAVGGGAGGRAQRRADRKSTRLNSSHVEISYAVFCLKKKMNKSLVSQCRL